MSAFCIPSGFSSRPLVLKVEQRFGSAGFARLIKMIELLAASPEAASGVVALPLSDWQEALGLGRDPFFEFINYLAKAEWLSLDAAEPGDPVRVTITNPAEFAASAAAPVQLFTKACQWAAWFVDELGMPSDQAGNPYFQQLFRRWCAVNVTREEAADAAQEAAKRRGSLAPAVLHEVLHEARTRRLAQARM